MKHVGNRESVEKKREAIENILCTRLHDPNVTVILTSAEPMR